MNSKSRYGKDRNKKVTDFIREVIKLSKQFDLSISHEDQHGGFEIVDYNDCYTAWLLQASDRTSKEKDK